MRKKEHMQCLRQQAEALKQTHLQLRRSIKQKRQTADILLVMGSGSTSGIGSTSVAVDTNTPEGNEKHNPASAMAMMNMKNTKVERLLKRPVTEIPDPSKIQELPSLHLPSASSCSSSGGHHTSTSTSIGNKKRKQGDNDNGEDAEEHDEAFEADANGDGINYALLQKNRSICTPQELDLIRKERNRMHAKRTRDRKRRFMEEMQLLIEQLQNENQLLEEYTQTTDTSTMHFSMDTMDQSLCGAPAPSLSLSLPMIPQFNVSDAAPVLALLAVPQQEQEHEPISPVPAPIRPAQEEPARSCVREEQEPPHLTVTAAVAVAAAVATPTAVPFVSHSQTVTGAGAGLTVPVALPAPVPVRAPVPDLTTSTGSGRTLMTVTIQKQAQAPPAELPSQLQYPPLAAHQTNSLPAAAAPCVILQESSPPPASAPSLVSLLAAAAMDIDVDVDVDMHVNVNMATPDPEQERRNQVWSVVAQQAAATSSSTRRSAPVPPSLVSLGIISTANSNAPSPVPMSLVQHQQHHQHHQHEQQHHQQQQHVQ
jgi:hypothetical protein